MLRAGAKQFELYDGRALVLAPPKVNRRYFPQALGFWLRAGASRRDSPSALIV